MDSSLCDWICISANLPIASQLPRSQFANVVADSLLVALRMAFGHNGNTAIILEGGAVPYRNPHGTHWNARSYRRVYGRSVRVHLGSFSSREEAEKVEADYRLRNGIEYRKKRKAMDINEAAQQCLVDGREWFGMVPRTTESLIYHVLGLVGEAGEVADEVKKAMRNDTSRVAFGLLTSDKFKEELIDVLVHWLNLVGQLEIDVDEEYNKKRTSNIARFGSHDA